MDTCLSQVKIMNEFDNHIEKKFTESRQSYMPVFEHFDKNSDGYLNKDEFRKLLEDLLSNGQMQQSITDEDANSVLSMLDLDNDGRLSLEEFRCAWLYWLKQVLSPVKALIIVDVQNDFITGSLALKNCSAGQDGAGVIPVINSLLEQDLFDLVIYTYDWHPENHISFIETVDSRKIHPTSKVPVLRSAAKVQEKLTFDIDGIPREQILWPKHCVQGSFGAQLADTLKVVPNAFHVYKGASPDVDSYSAFWDNSKLSKTNLASILSEKNVTDVYVCGLAYDVCVGFTAMDSLEHGFRTICIEDACRGVTLDGISRMRRELQKKGVYMTMSAEVPNLTRAALRPLCLAAQAAVNYDLAWKIIKEKSTSSS
ncbi:unnamed protein product [Lymnaea stagnalis]|uniref:nicotinamidase n=1 Tax=Lymnaea stagnalis TaxID=6523 RepID=A0AAV2HGK9_LYMST